MRLGQSSSTVPTRLLVLGIKPWKRWQVEPYLRLHASAIRYVRDAGEALAGQARTGATVLVWAAREPAGLADALADRGAALWRMEDGFLRSTGLGANHIGGASLVIDPVGIHFDPRRPSALEQRLNAGGHTPAELARAAALRAGLVAAGLSKYNIGTRTAPALGGAGRRRVLVVGQVEDDASVRLGTAAVRTNLDLLRAARAAEPDAWLVYKPHPDVEAGTRAGQVDTQALSALADEIVRDVSLPALLPQLSAVHVMTSLAGFEALLRGVPVTTWGAPFYAGWGLTDDRAPELLLRRQRRLSLDELIHAALIDYPLYVDLRSGARCEVEDVVARLAAQPPSTRAREASRLRRGYHLGRGLLRAWRPGRRDA